jgi:hypothetical protein
MAGNPNDPRRLQALEHIREAVRLLEVSQSKSLDHTDVTIVRAALDGLGTVLRVLAGASVPNDADLAARLRQVANAVKSCVEPDARIAYANVATAARMFQAITDPVVNA